MGLGVLFWGSYHKFRIRTISLSSDYYFRVRTTIMAIILEFGLLCYRIRTTILGFALLFWDSDYYFGVGTGNYFRVRSTCRLEPRRTCLKPRIVSRALNHERLALNHERERFALNHEEVALNHEVIKSLNAIHERFRV